ncbi:hypothetical protein JCM6882_009360 [Rhodosporidiobolus microsporus]
MPYINLPGSVQLFYELHSTTATSPTNGSSSTSSPPPPKPSLLLLAPSMLDNTFLTPYVEAFQDDYDICCLELRSHGRSRNQAIAGMDFWVAAADVAHAMEALHLAPSHFFGAGCLSFQVALKTAILFPSLVLSLTLAGAPTLFAPPRAVAAFVEITESWVRPADEDEWIDVIGGVGEFLLGERRFDGADEAWDRVLPPIVRRYNPWTASAVFMVTSPSQRSPGLTPEILATVKQPILFFQGDNDFCFGIEEVREQSTHFSGAKELEFHAVEGGPHMLGVTHASTVISHMRPFLARNNPSPLPQFAPLDALAALQLAAAIANDPKVALRNAYKPDSFSLHTAEERAAAQVILSGMEKVEKECELVLPMCSDKDDWEITNRPEEEGDHRWTWSTREEYGTPSSPIIHSRSSISSVHDQIGRPLSTFSLQDSVVVQVESTSEQTPLSPRLGKATGGTLESVTEGKVMANGATTAVAEV